MLNKQEQELQLQIKHLLNRIEYLKGALPDKQTHFEQQARLTQNAGFADGFIEGDDLNQLKQEIEGINRSLRGAELAESSHRAKLADVRTQRIHSFIRDFELLIRSQSEITKELGTVCQTALHTKDNAGIDHSIIQAAVQDIDAKNNQASNLIKKGLSLSTNLNTLLAEPLTSLHADPEIVTQARQAERQYIDVTKALEQQINTAGVTCTELQQKADEITAMLARQRSGGGLTKEDKRTLREERKQKHKGNRMRKAGYTE